jgi:CO/xanthine dehydrogenase Mo-binding subunit
MSTETKDEAVADPLKGTEGRQYRVIGTRPIRPDGTDKVTGRALYGADVHPTGLLHGAVLRSPHAHARILSIDTSAAEAMPGVRAVVTAADMPEGEDRIADHGEVDVNVRYQSWNVLARGKVLYHGHAVAAVAATSPHVAQEALKRIRVEYELLPPVLDVRQAMRAEGPRRRSPTGDEGEAAPILLDGLRTDELGKKLAGPTNVASHMRHERGDVEAGFARAAVIVEREFTTSMVHQGYIEPQNATALYNPDGQVTIWTSTQGAFGVRSQIEDLLEIPVSRVRVIPMEIGGGFGGKNDVYLEPLATLLSKKSGHRPVKLTMSRAEVLQATGPTSGSYIRVKMGADRAGRLTAAEAYLAYEAGAFPGSPVESGANVIFGPYRLDNVRVDGYDVVVNKPKTAAYRAPGGSNAAFAAETVVDELCVKLGMDPIEFRLLNGVQQGDRKADGPIFPRIGLLEVLRAAQEHPHYRAPLEGAHRGRGVACGYWGNYGGRSSASASINRDGTVSLVEGSVDIGGSRAAMAMQLAEVLEIPVTDVKPMVGDTDSVAYTEGTYGSRTTFATGWAMVELGLALKRQLCERAAELWEVAPEEVACEAGVFTAGARRITFKALAKEIGEGRPLMASATVFPETEGPAFACHIVDVEADPETGKVQILRYTALQDVGTAIHPAYVEGQLQGGAAQGIGWALNEEYFYDVEGHLLNASFLDYRIPTALDLPMIDTVLIEVANPGHPFGVRGVGEAPIVPPPAALANALYRALGVRMSVLPMSPAHVLEALWASGLAEE